MPSRDYIKQVQKGDPITAEWANSISRAVNERVAGPAVGNTLLCTPDIDIEPYSLLTVKSTTDTNDSTLPQFTPKVGVTLADSDSVVFLTNGETRLTANETYSLPLRNLMMLRATSKIDSGKAIGPVTSNPGIVSQEGKGLTALSSTPESGGYVMCQIAGGGDQPGELNLYQGVPIANMTSGTGYGHLVNRTRVSSEQSSQIIPGRRDIVVMLNDWGNDRIYPGTPISYSDNTNVFYAVGGRDLSNYVGNDYKILIGTEYCSPFPVLTLISGYGMTVGEFYYSDTYPITFTNATSSNIPVDDRYTWRLRLSSTYADTALDAMTASSSSTFRCNIPDVIYAYAVGASGKQSIGQMYNPLANWTTPVEGDLMLPPVAGGTSSESAVDISAYVSGGYIRLPITQNTYPLIPNSAFIDLFEICYKLGEYSIDFIPGNSEQMRMDIPVASLTNKTFYLAIAAKSYNLGRITFRRNCGWYKIT